MFYDNPNLIQIEEKIWVYKGFVPEEKVKEINDLMSKYTYEDFIIDRHGVDWYKDKAGPMLPELLPVWNMVSEFLAPEYSIHPGLSLQVMKPGDTMFVHADSPGEGNDHELTAHDVWSTCAILDYGIVSYFGDFEGGEVFYPQLGIEYAVRPGDLVIHGAHSKHEHGVREVKSGMRYAYSNFMLKTAKNPGTFHTYGTEESNIAQQDPNKWIAPIFHNPYFDKEGNNILRQS